MNSLCDINAVQKPAESPFLQKSRDGAPLNSTLAMDTQIAVYKCNIISFYFIDPPPVCGERLVTISCQFGKVLHIHNVFNGILFGRICRQDHVTVKSCADLR